MRYLYVGLITGICTLAAIRLWLGLFRKHRVSGVSTRQLLIITLAVGFVCRVSFAFLTPTFYAPDEQPHFKYVQYLAENRSLPVQTSQTGSPTNDWEYYQPPLYYLSLTPCYWLSQTLFHEEAATVRFLRAFSIMLWAITALLTIRFLDSLNIQDAFTKIFVTSMISLLPSYTFLSSVINSDNLVMAIGSAILYLVVQPKASPKNSALLGILLGLGLLTKLTAAVYIVLIAFTLLIGLVRRTIGRPTIAHLILPIVLAAIIWAPWAWRSLNVYGSITAEEVANVPWQWRSLIRAAWGILEDLQVSFWAVSGIHNNVSFFYPTIGMHVFYLAMMGLLYGLLSKRGKLVSLARANINIIIASAVAILIDLVLVFRFGLMYGQGQGRFLFPMLIPISLLMAIGLRVFSASDADRAHIHLVGFFCSYATSFTAYSLAMFTRIE